MFRVLSISTLLALHQSEAAFLGEHSFSKSWGLRASGSFFPLPLPRHSFYFCSRPSFSRRTRAETLATQATPITIWPILPKKKKVGKMAIFGPTPWVNPLEKMPIFRLFGLLVFIA